MYNDNFSSTVVQRVNVEGEQWLAPVLVVLGAQDELVGVVDLESGSGAVGFVGKASEVSCGDLGLQLIPNRHLKYNM